MAHVFPLSPTGDSGMRGYAWYAIFNTTLPCSSAQCIRWVAMDACGQVGFASNCHTAKGFAIEVGSILF